MLKNYIVLGQYVTLAMFISVMLIYKKKLVYAFVTKTSTLIFYGDRVITNHVIELSVTCTSASDLLNGS